MKSFTSRHFRDCYAKLPASIQIQARRSYRLFRANPYHPGLNFKKLDAQLGIYSARVGIGYRVLGRFDGPDIVWYWIGTHSDYDQLV